MGGTALAPTRARRLVDAVFDGASDDPLAVEVAAWVTGSRRFRAFLDEQRDKVRKKLRGATDREARLDVRAELRMAHRLLADRHLQLVFEGHGSTSGGPDFTVTYRGERSFNLEVTRLRGSPERVDLSRSLLAKLRQLPPGEPNAVCFALGGTDAGAPDVAATVQEIRRRADALDAGIRHSLGIASTRAFYDRFLRVGAVVIWCEAASGDARAAAWVNPSARIALPDRGLRACLRCIRAGA